MYVEEKVENTPGTRVGPGFRDQSLFCIFTMRKRHNHLIKNLPLRLITVCVRVVRHFKIIWYKIGSFELFILHAT